MSARQLYRNRLQGLYAITDEKLITEDNFRQKVEAALLGGCRIIQYRDKSDDQEKRLQQATLVQSLCTEHHATCIINDDIELAKAVDADGVHLGRDDVSISEARVLLGHNSIIGVSCYDDLNLALCAEKEGADYVAFGAVFSSPTKPHAKKASPELIRQAKLKLKLPVCAIGGITEDNIRLLQGNDMAAVISSLFASDDIRCTAENLSRYFG